MKSSNYNFILLINFNFEDLYVKNSKFDIQNNENIIVILLKYFFYYLFL